MEPTSGVFEGVLHSLPVRVYYEDTDFTGIVYHASYVRFLERGRSDFLRAAGVRHAAMAELGAAFAVTRLEIEFRRPARIDDALRVETEITGAGGARLAFRQAITRAGEVLCQARVGAACIDLSGRARRPPPQIREVLTPYLPEAGSP